MRTPAGMIVLWLTGAVVAAMVACSTPCPEQKTLMAEHVRLDSVAMTYYPLLRGLVNQTQSAVATAPDSLRPQLTQLGHAAGRLLNEIDLRNLRHLHVEQTHARYGLSCDTIRADYAAFAAEHRRWQRAVDSLSARARTLGAGSPR